MTDNTPPEIEPAPTESGNAVAVVVVFSLLVVVLLLMFGGMITPSVNAEQDASAPALAFVPTATIGIIPPTLEQPIVEVAQAHPYAQAAVDNGQRIYASLCFACHGADARGVPGLGKTLVESEFINGLTDEAFIQFMIVGRQPGDPLNTTGQLMPARGGNPALTDADLADVVAYIRVLNGAPLEGGDTQTDSSDMAIVPLATVHPFEPAPINALDPSVVPPSSGAVEGLNIDNLDSEGAFIWACSTCHADRAALAENDMSDEDIVALLTSNALPDEQTAFVHPYRGGYPELNDAQIQALIAYLRGS
jgi:disulfide bond formation protein DsbB